jgi:TolB-like protein
VDGFWQRLKQRKLVQWALAWVAFAFALLQGVDIVAQRFNWPGAIERYLILALIVGFFVVLVLAWYHGEKGAQRVGGMEIMILALLLAIGGALMWRFGAVAANKPRATLATAPAAASSAAISAQPIPAKSIAVLPFQNLSNDKDNAYFVEGMQDLILTKLADIGGLKVIARTSTAKYASRPEDVKTIGQQLGVATLLEGSVQKAGNQVLVNVQLIDAASGAHIWAQDYTRTLDNVFGVEGDVAEQVAAALKAKLSPAETARLASDMSASWEANNLFLEADQQTHQGDTNYDTAKWKAAIPLYQQAIAQAPTFALAYARLSYAQSLLAWFGGGGMDVPQLITDARSNAEQALKLAPRLPAAQLAIGYSDYYGRGDYDAALKAFAAALALRPNDADTVAAQGLVQRRQGRFDAAVTSFQKAIALDPRNSTLTFQLGLVWMQVSRYPEAERAFQRALALDPNNRNAKEYLSIAILFASGDIPRALAAVQGDDPQLKLAREGLLIYQRKYQQALALLDGVPDIPDNFAIASTPKAIQQAELYRLMSNAAHARLLYAQELPQIHARLAQIQGINQAFVWQNLAEAELGLGHSAQGLDAIAKAQAVVEHSHDRLIGVVATEYNAALYATAKRPDLVVPLLAKALASPGIGYTYAPVLLWLDPAWDPIRHDPRFQALLQKYAQYKPAVIPVAPAASPVASPLPGS